MPDHRSGRRGDVGKHYAVTSNVPTDITNPKRKVRLIAAAWVVALVMCTVAGAYVAATVAIERNDDSKRQLLAELDRRTKQRIAESEQFQHALDQYRTDQCQITARLPQDPDVVDIRRRYRCTNPVIPVPAPAPTQSPAGAPGPVGSLPAFIASPPVFGRPARPPAAGPGAGVPAPGPVPAPQPPTPVVPVPALPVPAPPVVPPPLPQPGPRCIALLGVGVCLALGVR